MVQGSEGFKLIKVAQDEDDVVIQAGIRETAVEVEPAVDEAELIDSSDFYEDEEIEDESEVEIEEFDADEEEADEDLEVPAAPPAKRKKWDGYETTADDLVGSPMPVAQKATIVVALLLLALAIAYCTFFM